MSATAAPGSVLEDGLVLEARSVAASGTALGEMVFTTGMTGYQEAVTDPSYLGQILCFAAPMIGNHGAGPGARRERAGLAGGRGDGPRRRRAGCRRGGRLVRVAARARRRGRRRLRHPPPGAPPARPGAMRGGVSDELGPEELLARVREHPVLDGRDLAAEAAGTRGPWATTGPAWSPSTAG